MKNTYKDNLIYLGFSDISQLLLRPCNKDPKILKMGKDGIYKAWLVTSQDVEIPDHYKLNFIFKTWLKVYDDEMLTATIRAKEILVYTAGEMGVLIRALNGTIER